MDRISSRDGVLGCGNVALQNTCVVLMCGGSGDRVWPISTIVPKAMFRFGGALSPLEHNISVMRHFNCLKLYGSIGPEFASFLEFFDLEPIVEPLDGLDTMRSVIYSLQCVSGCDFVVFVPCDQKILVDWRVFQSEIDGLIAAMIAKSSSVVGLICTKQKLASSLYGYVQCDGDAVRGFIEKPNDDQFASLVCEDGLYLQNSGIFVVHRERFLDVIDELAVVPECGSIDRQFFALNPEKLCFIASDLLLEDYGNWASVAHNLCINYDKRHYDSCTSDAMLNSAISGNKSLNYRSKLLTIDCRRWGFCSTIANGTAANNFVFKVKYIQILPGCNISKQAHSMRREMWFVVSGRIVLWLDGVERRYSAGQAFLVDYHSVHMVQNVSLTDVAIAVEIQYGNFVSETDIVRFDLGANN